MPKKVEKALLAYLAAHLVHWLFDAVVDEQARKRGWSGGQIELAKVGVGAAMLLL